MDRSRRASMAMPPPPPSMSAAKVIVSTYEELPRRRRLPVGVITTGKAPAPTRATGGDYDRRTLLLAYVQQLRRRRRQGGGGHRRQSGPPLLEWCQWKRQAAGRPPLAIAAVAAGDVAMVGRRRRSWCSRLRSCVRLWAGAFLRRVRSVRENASCKKGDKSDRLLVTTSAGRAGPC